MDLMAYLREAVRSSGETWAAIARRAKIPYSVLHRAMDDEKKALNLMTLQKLAAALEMEIVIRPKFGTGRKA